MGKPRMEMETKIIVTSRSKQLGEKELLLGDTQPPKIEEGDPSHLGDIARKKSVHAERCVYCGSRENLTDEHVIPYAWGGSLQIFRGSCEQCREETQQFENFALNDGAMTGVRKVRGVQSRSGHNNAPKSIAVALTKNDGREVKEEIALDVVPLILGFPWFPLPGMLEGSTRSSIDLAGWLTVSVGPNVEQFLKARDAKAMRVSEDRKQPVAFARAMAKIAYCYAWLDGVFDYLTGSSDLVHAFMREPSQLGAFVGMKPEPFERFPGMDFRLLYRPDKPGLLYMEVQPFPDIPAPTYLVVLGACKSLRVWRNIRSRVSAGMKPMKQGNPG